MYVLNGYVKETCIPHVEMRNAYMNSMVMCNIYSLNTLQHTATHDSGTS